MAEEHTYANLNPYPVTTNAPKGGRRFINPKEVVRGEWWGIFAGDDKPLTRIDEDKYNILGSKVVETKDISKRGKTAPSNTRNVRNASKKKSKTETLADDVCRVGCENDCQSDCQLNEQGGITEADHWRKVDDTYYCKYCDNNSVVKSDILMHIRNMHEDELDIEEPPKEEKPEQKELPEGVKEEEEGYYVLNDDTFQCKECYKEYKTLSWMVKHINSEHRILDE